MSTRRLIGAGSPRRNWQPSRARIGLTKSWKRLSATASSGAASGGISTRCISSIGPKSLLTRGRIQLPIRRAKVLPRNEKAKRLCPPRMGQRSFGSAMRSADVRIRANLFKLASERTMWLGRELNPRHEDFQSSALPTELPSRSGKSEIECRKSKRISDAGLSLWRILFGRQATSSIARAMTRKEARCFRRRNGSRFVRDDKRSQRQSVQSPTNLRGRSIACVQEVQIEAARNFFRAELLQMRSEPLGVEQGKPARAHPLDQRPERDLGGAGRAMKHRFPEKRAADRDAVEAADEFVSRPGFDGVRMAELVQLRVAGDDLVVDPGVGAALRRPGSRRRSGCRSESRSPARGVRVSGHAGYGKYPAARSCADRARTTGSRRPPSPSEKLPAGRLATKGRDRSLAVGFAMIRREVQRCASHSLAKQLAAFYLSR